MREGPARACGPLTQGTYVACPHGRMSRCIPSEMKWSSVLSEKIYSAFPYMPRDSVPLAFMLALGQQQCDSVHDPKIHW